MTISNAERTGDNEEVAAVAQTSVEQVEGEIRAFVRRDISVFRRTRAESTEAVDSINSIVERVAGASLAEIERVMDELNSVRDMLRSEGDRVQRELAGYASLSQAAMTSIKIIGDSLVQLKSGAPHLSHAKD
jgi:hypothetical protein